MEADAILLRRGLFHWFRIYGFFTRMKIDSIMNKRQMMQGAVIPGLRVIMMAEVRSL